MHTREVEQAFDALDGASELVSAVMRPVLMRAIQDPPTIRALGEHALLEHLQVVWHVLKHMRDGAALEKLPVLPRDVSTFENWVLGTPLEDAEDAFNYVNSLPKAERARLGAALALTVQVQKRSSESLSLLAMAHLLQFALADRTFLEHVFSGGTIDDFLPANGSGLPPSSSNRVIHRPPEHELHDSPSRNQPQIKETESWVSQARSTFFEGKLIRVLVRPEPQLPLMVVDGICTEISANHVVVVTRNESRDDSASNANVLLFGMNSVFRISVVREATGA